MTSNPNPALWAGWVQHQNEPRYERETDKYPVMLIVVYSHMIWTTVELRWFFGFKKKYSKFLFFNILYNLKPDGSVN